MHPKARTEAVDPKNLPIMETDWIKRKFLNIPYVINGGNSRSLDIYLPDEGIGPFPVIIFIHGGAFIAGDKSDFQCEYVINGIEQGFAVASVNYRFSNDVLFPYPLFDVKAAVRYLRANANRYYLDPNRFAAVGASAGAYFAAMLATTSNITAFEDPNMGNPEINTSIQTAVGLFGVYDLAETSAFLENLKTTQGPNALFNYSDLFIGTKASECPNLLSLTWPGSFVNKNCPPFLIQAGTADQVVPYENSVSLFERINSVCGNNRAIFEPFQNCGHGDPAFGSDANKERILQFLDTYLK